MSGMYKCTVIKGRVMEELKFGFNSHDIPITLVNNTSPMILARRSTSVRMVSIICFGLSTKMLSIERVMTYQDMP